MSYGRARATHAYTPGVLTGLDAFTGRTAGAVLGGTSAQVGGSWATSGSATDLAASDGPTTGDETLYRMTAGDLAHRFAILGTTTATDVEVGLNVRFTGYYAQSQALVARYTDANNYLAADLSNGGLLMVKKTVAGSLTTIATVTASGSGLPANTWYSLRLRVWASGYGIAEVLTSGGGTLLALPFTDTALATGGALATGKRGFYDDSGPLSGGTRYYDAFYAATPAPEPIALHASQSIEFRSDTTLREDSTGTYAGPPPEYVGSRFFVPPAGGPGRKTRIAVMAKRNDVETMPDDHIADSTTVEVWIKPRFLAVPR